MSYDYQFYGGVSEEVLCNYLRRSITISCGPELHPERTDYVQTFILNIGAKYICRAATHWRPSKDNVAAYAGQKAFIEQLHRVDPDVVFEACIFECVGPEVESLDVPAWVFEAFGLEATERKFRLDAMRFADDSYRDQWGKGTTVPNMTQLETQMFFYYRACEYINAGFEALHMGQIHLIGKYDEGWTCWTRVLKMVREYARTHARRAFVFINAHTPGMLDSDGKLMFDFHMYPLRPVADCTQEPHFPTEDNPQRAYIRADNWRSIYGRSLGGMTQSGWETDTLPYCVEIDNFGDNLQMLHTPADDCYECWGMDEINWFAHQPAWYRAKFLQYAYDWVRDEAPGKCFLAMPGQRCIRLRDEQGTIIGWMYNAFDKATHPDGFGDESAIKAIWTK